VHDVLPCRRALAVLGVVAQGAVPPAVVACEVAGDEPAHAVVDADGGGAVLVDVDQVDPAGAAIDVPAQAQPLHPAGEPAPVGGRRVAEAAVDRRLRCPQPRDRLTLLLVHLVELTAHDRRQHAASPVGGGDGHPGDARTRDDGAGHGQLQAVDARSGDDPAPVPQPQRAVQLRDRRGLVDERAAWLLAEHHVHRPGEGRPLLGGDRAQPGGEIVHGEVSTGRLRHDATEIPGRSAVAGRRNARTSDSARVLRG
jgi:hypothetical protein